MVYKTKIVGLNSYLQYSRDKTLQAVLRYEKKKKLHSVVKESMKFKFQRNMAQEEIGINTKPTNVS